MGFRACDHPLGHVTCQPCPHRTVSSSALALRPCCATLMKSHRMVNPADAKAVLVRIQSDLHDKASEQVQIGATAPNNEAVRASWKANLPK